MSNLLDEVKKRATKIPKDAQFTPEGGVYKLVQSFGGKKRIIAAAEAMGIKVSSQSINTWTYKNLMPKHVYNALSHLLTLEESHVLGSMVEVRFRGKFIGEFHLAPEMTLVTRIFPKDLDHLDRVDKPTGDIEPTKEPTKEDLI